MISEQEEATNQANTYIPRSFTLATPHFAQTSEDNGLRLQSMRASQMKGQEKIEVQDMMFAMQLWPCKAPRRGLHHLRTYKTGSETETVKTNASWDEGTSPSMVRSVFNLWY